MLSAILLPSYILNKLRKKELHRVLFVGTGALLSPTSSLQGESIPGIAHAVLLTSD
jgi:stage V sporulation protein AD